MINHEYLRLECWIAKKYCEKQVVGKSVDQYYVIKVTASQHTAIHKAIGYFVNKPKLPWTLENAIKYGELT